MKRQKKRKMRIKASVIHLTSSRHSTTPFCAYYGPHGETCNSTNELAWVWRIPGMPGMPPLGYMACPHHYTDVEETVKRFLASVIHPSPDE